MRTIHFDPPPPPRREMPFEIDQVLKQRGRQVLSGAKMDASASTRLPHMAIYAKPSFAVQEVNSSGKAIAKFFHDPRTDFLSQAANLTKALDAIENFRASHAFPLNTLLMTLRNRAKYVRAQSLTAQRIKRLESIMIKLANERAMKLSQMQDIGGCRAIVPSLKHVRELRQIYLDRPLAHTYNGEKDYISAPRDTGYRGIHLKYRFCGRGMSMPWDGLKIEIQLRTQLQHKWATAVEAAATFTDQALKSNRGSHAWLRFFSLMGSVFALREGCEVVPGTHETVDSLAREIAEIDRENLIQETFAQYHAIIPQISSQKGAGYFLVVLDPLKREVKVEGFRRGESQVANKRYTQAETLLPKTTNVVLVSVSSISALKRAYPNYFMDTADFLREVRDLTAGPGPAVSSIRAL